MLDLTKPVQTRDGRKVEILSTKGRGDFPIIGHIGVGMGIFRWRISGDVDKTRDMPAEGDLVNVPEEKWVNIYTVKGKGNDLSCGLPFSSKNAALQCKNSIGYLATIPLHEYMK